MFFSLIFGVSVCAGQGLFLTSGDGGSLEGGGYGEVSESPCSICWMRVQDEELWFQQFGEFDADEMSRKFRDFLVFWLEASDGLLSDSGGDLAPYTAISKGFEVTEQTFGYIASEWIGQMLLVVVQHWADGPALWEELSVFERRMVEQATAMKLVELQESARVGVDDDASGSPETV